MVSEITTHKQLMTCCRDEAGLVKVNATLCDVITYTGLQLCGSEIVNLCKYRLHAASVLEAVLFISNQTL